MFSMINLLTNSSNAVVTLADKVLEKITPSTSAFAIRCYTRSSCGACGTGSCGSYYKTCGKRTCCDNGWCGPSTTWCVYCGGGTGHI